MTIQTGALRQTREVCGGGGQGSDRSDTDCRFGVGKACLIERVEVRWNDSAGAVQVFEDVPACRFYRLKQGEGLERN